MRRKLDKHEKRGYSGGVVEIPREDLMAKSSLLLTASAAVLVLGACSSLAGERPTPDEFKVVTKAPLNVPPEYSLRPPPAGQAQPAEVVQGADMTVSFGQDFGQNASVSERLLIASADAIAVNPIIRSQVDYEEAGIIRKNRNFADRVLFWRGTEEEQADAATDSATGGETIAIEKSGQPRVKLPGT